MRFTRRHVTSGVASGESNVDRHVTGLSKVALPSALLGITRKAVDALHEEDAVVGGNVDVWKSMAKDPGH